MGSIPTKRTGPIQTWSCPFSPTAEPRTAPTPAEFFWHSTGPVYYYHRWSRNYDRETTTFSYILRNKTKPTAPTVPAPIPRVEEEENYLMLQHRLSLNLRFFLVQGIYHLFNCLVSYWSHLLNLLAMSPSWKQAQSSRTYVDFRPQEKNNVDT